MYVGNCSKKKSQLSVFIYYNNECSLLKDHPASLSNNCIYVNQQKMFTYYISCDISVYI